MSGPPKQKRRKTTSESSYSRGSASPSQNSAASRVTLTDVNYLAETKDGTSLEQLKDYLGIRTTDVLAPILDEDKRDDEFFSDVKKEQDVVDKIAKWLELINTKINKDVPKFWKVFRETPNNDSASRGDASSAPSDNARPASSQTEELGRVRLFQAYTNRYSKAKPMDNGDGDQESETFKWKDYPKNDHGALISTRSKSDFALFNTDTGELVEIECKYGLRPAKIENAFCQLFSYLYNQLWWFRYGQQLNVERVFGFAIIADSHGFYVIILVLSLPEKIGGKSKLFRYDANGKEGLEAMEIVLQNKFYKISDLIKPDNRAPITCPGEMMIPPALLKEMKENKSVWKVVRNGTGNLVLKFTPSPDDGSLEEAKKYVKDNFQFDPEERDNLEILNEFIEENRTIYTKIKIRSSGKLWNSSRVQNVKKKSVLEGNNNNISKYWMETLYPKNFILNNDANVMILMRHMGCKLTELDEKSKPELPDFCSMFLKLMEATIFVQKKVNLVHGDIHQGNLLYDESNRKLCIIDWDEAFESESAPDNYRVGTTDETKELYPAVRWKNPVALTKMQLFVLFRDVISNHYNKVLQVKATEDDESSKKVHLQIGEEGEQVSLWQLIKKLGKTIMDTTDAELIVSRHYDALKICLEEEERKVSMS